jgi:hypothetical protein
MSVIAKCPICGKSATEMLFGAGWAQTGFSCCGFSACTIEKWNQYAAAMEHARATIELENAMKPLNDGKRPMVKAFPRIKAAMERVQECESRVLEVFK